MGAFDEPQAFLEDPGKIGPKRELFGWYTTPLRAIPLHAIVYGGVSYVQVVYYQSWSFFLLRVVRQVSVHTIHTQPA